jgi:hypothetical protein
MREPEFGTDGAALFATIQSPRDTKDPLSSSHKPVPNFDHLSLMCF